MFCPSCGKELPDDSQFCTACGASLGAVSTKHRSWKKPLIITVLVLALLASAGVLLPRLIARRSHGAPALIPYRKGDTWGFCNRTRKLVLPAVYDWVLPFVHGLARVELSGEYGYVDMNGTLVAPTVYRTACFFSDGLACVQFGDKWGYINTKGTLVIPAVYERAEDFVGGLAIVEIDDKLGFIDTKGTQYWED